MTTDWTTTAGCATCDLHGPFLPGDFAEAGRNAHQAIHAMTAAMLKPLGPLVESMNRFATGVAKAVYR